MSTPPLNRPPHEEPEDAPSLLYGDTPDEVIKGHKYDGIKEYDNPMPSWWVWLFVLTVVFSVIYVAGIEIFGFIDTYTEDLAESRQELQLVRDAYAAANPVFEADEATLARYAEDPSMAEAGAANYAAVCAACHGDAGQGLIGPNLTDEYWIHGGTNADIYRILAVGVPEKGMPGWEGSLSPEERAQLVALIRSFEGTSPPGAKEPQGEPVG